MASGQEELSVRIPPEIITEILYRLPAKSIGRFRCVSKSWLSQLTHPNFIKIHFNNTSSDHNNHLIFKTSHIKRSIIKDCSMFLYSHPFHSHEAVVTAPTKFDLQLNSYVNCADVCGSCDGLVLVRVFCEYIETMVVINPTTRECLHLPEIDYDNLYDSHENIYGFGYDSVTDDYKVVSLTHYCLEDGCLFHKVYAYVYSLRNKTWKRAADSPRCYSRSCGVFVSGFIHWVVSHDDGLRSIAAFSLADECFSEVSFPKFYDDNNALKTFCKLFVLGGKFAIFIRNKDEVWLMNEYGVRESWTKILLHGIDKVPLLKPELHTELSVFDDNGKVLVANNHRMMVYEVEKATFTETVCVWNPKIFRIAGLYVESLVSPKLGKEEEDNDDADIESVKAGVAVANDEMRKTIAALPETVNNTLH